MPATDQIHAQVRQEGLRRRKHRRLAKVGAPASLCLAALAATVLFRPDQHGQELTTVPASTTTSESAPPTPAVSITVSPSAPTVGELVTFTVDVLQGPIVNGIIPNFGDASPDRHLAGSSLYGCGTESPPEARTQVFGHSYSRPGTFTFTATASIYDPCAASNPIESATATTTLNIVTSATNPSNGAENPQGVISAAGEVGGSQHEMTASVGGSDFDGYIRSLTLDWGDATAPSTVARPLGDCKAGANGWPDPYDAGTEQLPHEYAAPGPYVVTLTITSTGCDGLAPQLATTAITIEVP